MNDKLDKDPLRDILVKYKVQPPERPIGELDRILRKINSTDSEREETVWQKLFNIRWLVPIQAFAVVMFFVVMGNFMKADSEIDSYLEEFLAVQYEEAQDEYESFGQEWIVLAENLARTHQGE